MSPLFLIIIKGQCLHFISTGNSFFTRTNTARYAHTRGESEHGFVFFMRWEGLWDKGCDAMPVEFSLDQSCSQWQHNDEHGWMSASMLETCAAATAPRRFPGQEPLIGIPGWRWVCRLLGWLEIRKKKNKNQGSDWNPQRAREWRGSTEMDLWPLRRT